MKIGIFKKFNHRKFSYLPRYYDADKESLDAIVGKYDKDIDQTELRKKRISTGFSSKKSNIGVNVKTSRRGNLRLILIIAILCYISYTFMMSDKFFKLLEALT